MLTNAPTASPAEPSSATQLSELRAVNLQLQATIDQLRAELEVGAAHTGAAVQQVKVENADEVRLLISTVQKIRDQMEQQAIAAEAANQALRAAGQVEATQLRATIDVLRTELERARADGAQSVGDAHSLFARERATLQQQIQAMRDQLDHRA